MQNVENQDNDVFINAVVGMVEEKARLNSKRIICRRELMAATVMMLLIILVAVFSDVLFKEADREDAFWSAVFLALLSALPTLSWLRNYLRLIDAERGLDAKMERAGVDPSILRSFLKN